MSSVLLTSTAHHAPKIKPAVLPPKHVHRAPKPSVSLSIARLEDLLVVVALGAGVLDRLREEL